MGDSTNAYKSGDQNKALTPKMQHEQMTKKEEHDFLLKKQNNEIGYIGRIFGESKHASKNIAVTLCVLLILGATIISCWVYYIQRDTALAFIKSLWTNIIPIISISLGYIFGKQ